MVEVGFVFFFVWELICFELTVCKTKVSPNEKTGDLFILEDRAPVMRR